MPRALTPKLIEKVFALVAKAAARGLRCPQNDELGTVGARALQKLAHTGWIKIEVYALNWRVVEILSGPHEGQRTAPPHVGKTPYIIVDKNGSHRDTAVQRSVAAKAEPSQSELK